MSFNDPIAEILTKLRNAKSAQHRYVDAHLSRQKLSVIKILKDQGFITNYLINEKKRKVRVFLKYSKRKPVISDLQRVSKPGLRKYVGYEDIPEVYGGLGIAILSTSKGIIDDKTAREMKVGGELLCYVW